MEKAEKKEDNEKEAQEGQDGLLEDLSKLEDEARRKERKRKEGGKEKKSKRRKLDRLVGWGEMEEEGSSHQEGVQEWLVRGSTESSQV